MNGDKDQPDNDGKSDGKPAGSVNLSSYLKDNTPTMARILQEEEARTAALAASADDVGLEFTESEDDDAAPGEADEPPDADPFIIMEEESFDISFDNLDDTLELADEDLLGVTGDAYDGSANEDDDLVVSHGSHGISLDEDETEQDEAGETTLEDDFDDEDLGPPLPDLSAPAVDDTDLLNIAFVGDEAADDEAGDLSEEAPTSSPALPETPVSAEPLDLASFDEGLDIAFSEDSGPEPVEQDTDVTGTPEPVQDAPMTGGAAESDEPDIEMVTAGDEAGNDEEDASAAAEDEFAGWGDDDAEDDLPEGDVRSLDDGDPVDDGNPGDWGGDDEDLGPPLPDLSAPGPESTDPAEAVLGHATTVIEEEEEELTLEIEGFEFQPGDTLEPSEPAATETRSATALPSETGDEEASDDAAFDVEQAVEAETVSAQMPKTETDLDPEPAPEAAPGVAEKAKPVTVQEALMAAIELHRVGDLEGAAHGYEMLVRRYPNAAAGWINLGIVLRRLGKLDASLVCLRRGVMLNPKDGASWSNLGNALRAANYLEDAKRAQIKAISLTPGAAQIHYNMGLVTRDFGELGEADSCFRRADLLGYNNPDLAWDRSLNLLLSGNLEEGFAAYEARWNLPDTPQRYADLPRWQGEMQRDKTVVIHAEQGLGDSLQFCRYVPTLKSRVGKLIFEVQPQLADLLAASPWFRGVEIQAREQASVAADMQMPLLSSPVLLPLGESVLPGRDPYLSPPANGPRIRETVPAPRIGIAWAGKPTHKNDANRSAGLSSFTALFDLLNARFYSLQVGPAQTQIKTLALNSVVQDLSPAIRSFADTASLLQDLDLVVTVDTSVAHLAGAMGKPVWVVLPFSPDWRWQLRREDSPWYPSMRLFRQTSPGDWDSVFMKVRTALDEWIDARNDG